MGYLRNSEVRNTCRSGPILRPRPSRFYAPFEIGESPLWNLCQHIQDFRWTTGRGHEPVRRRRRIDYRTKWTPRTEFSAGHESLQLMAMERNHRNQTGHEHAP